MGYDYYSDETKIEILKRQVRFLSSFGHARIHIVPTSEDFSQHYDEQRKKIKKDNPVYDEAMYFTQSTQEYLESAANEFGTSYTTYVVIKLDEIAVSDIIARTAKEVKSFLAEPAQKAIDFLTAQPEDIPLYLFERYKEKEEKTFSQLSARMIVTRTTSGETQWLLKRVMFRGVDIPIKLNKVTKIVALPSGKTKKVYTADWLPRAERNFKFIRPEKNDVVNLFSGVISSSKKAVQIEHDNVSSYQAFLSLSHIPDSYEFPGNEWIYILQHLPYETEISIDIENIEYREAKKKISDKQVSLNSQYDEAVNSIADVPDSILIGKQLGAQLDDELKDARLPLQNVTFTICLSDTNLENLDKKVEHLKNYYGDMNYIFERSAADQMKFFMESIPGTEKYSNAYSMKLSPSTLASGVIGVNNRLGDDVGYYIGTAGERRQAVFLYLGLANQMNKAAGATFYGNLGYGKSFNANLLVYLHVLFGAYALVFDPKSERSHWGKLPFIGHLVNIVTIESSDEYKGTLDPFNLYRDDMEKAAQTALSVVMDLLKMSMQDEDFTVLNEALEVVKKGKQPSMKAVVDVLSNWERTDMYFDDAQKLGRRLLAMQKNGINKLLFGDGSEKAITFSNRLNIVQIHNLQLPDQEQKKEDYSTEENSSAVIMGLLGDFAKQFAMSKKDGFKVFLFDESWFMCKTSAGLKAIDFLCRTSRSLNAAVILNGHSVNDLPSETAQNTITYKFCFHTSSYDEAQRMLEYMQMDVTPENISILTTDPEDGGLGNGECLFQDAYGRVGRLKFDAVFDDLIEAFKTTPVDATKIDEEETKITAANIRQIVAEQPGKIYSRQTTQEEEQQDIIAVSSEFIMAYENAVRRYGF